MTVLRIPRTLYDAIRAHGEEAWPEECCGVLLGRRIEDGWQVVALRRAQNAASASSRTRYAIDASELVRIAGESRRESLEIAGFYHSHPGCEAHWSATDLEEAHWIGASYVITKVAGGKAAATRSFYLAGAREEDKRFEPEQIELT